MHDTSSPIELSVDTNRLFMEGLHSLLDLRFVNRSGEERFRADVALTGRLLPEGGRLSVDLAPGGTRTQALELHLPQPESGRMGSAGYARFEVELVVRTEEEGDHLFVGEFNLAVLAHSEDRSQVNINIGKVIEQHGKGGTGGINELALSQLVKLPETITVNELIMQERAPHFVEITLDHRGPIESETPLLVRPALSSLERCNLERPGEGTRTLVLTGGTIVFGRSREKADIVCWVQPRTQKSDLSSRKISSRHCQLRFGMEAIRLEHLSRSNLTSLDDAPVEGRLDCSLDRTHDLDLARVMSFKISPVPAAPVPPAVADAWFADATPAMRHRREWSLREGIGGLLLRRTDGFAGRECYLWLFSSVTWPLPAEGEGAGADCAAALLVTPQGLAFGSMPEAAPIRVGEEVAAAGKAIVLAEGDVCTVGRGRWTVATYGQALS